MSELSERLRDYSHKSACMASWHTAGGYRDDADYWSAHAADMLAAADLLDATAAPVVVGEDMESFRRLIQKAADNINVPKLTPARAEYWKAGARAAIASFNEAMTSALAGEDRDA